MSPLIDVLSIAGFSCKNDTAKQYDAYTCAANGLDPSECLGKDESCPAIDWLMPIIMALYTLITNVLMLNLLIAMFK